MSSEDERFFQQGFQAAMGDEGKFQALDKSCHADSYNTTVVLDNDDEETVETGVGTKSKGKQPEKSVSFKSPAASYVNISQGGN